MRLLLALEIVAPGDLDGALVASGAVSIERNAGQLLVDCADALVSHATTIFARAGARATVAAGSPSAAPGLRPAVARDLVPRQARVDRISIRALDTGEAATRLLRRRWRVLRPAPARVHVARRILRGEDRLYAWRRIVWSTAEELRSTSDASVVPIVFDREALTRSVERMALTSDGLLAKWARP